MFVVAALALLVTPGPAVLYIVTRSVDQGRLAGFVSTLGISTGTLFHITAAALGLSAILMTSALAFGVVKYLGAAYLIYLGLRRILGRDGTASPAAAGRQPLARIFFQGVLVNLLNPKTALFFFAFLPQFVDVSRGPVASQILALGLTYVMLAILNDNAYALLAGTLASRLRHSSRVLTAQRYVAGGVYITLGVVAAVAGPGKK